MIPGSVTYESGTSCNLCRGPLKRLASQVTVNGATRQHSNVSNLIWNIREILADLSQVYHLAPGDVSFKGTPEGVGPVVVGDELEGRVDGVGSTRLTVGPAEQS